MRDVTGHASPAGPAAAEPRAPAFRPTRYLLRARSNSLLRNSLYIMSTALVSSLLGYVYWLIAARAYSAHNVGLAAALISAMTLASTVSSLGVGSALVQILPRRGPGRPSSLALTAGFAVGTVAAAVAAGVCVVGLLVFSSELGVIGGSLVYALVFAAGVVLWTVSTLLDYTFVAERAAGNTLVRNLLFSALKIPLLLVPFLAAAGAIGILASWVLAAAVASAAGVLLLSRLTRSYRPAIKGVTAEVRAMASALVGHHLINVGGVMPMYVLPMFVAVRLSPTDNAYFYATWMAGGLFFMVSAAVASALFAEGSHASEDIAAKVRASTIIIAALIGPPMLLLLAAGDRIMAMFGSEYAEHAFPLLTLLVASAVPEAVVSVYVSVLRVQLRLRFAALLTLATASITLALAWVLLPSLEVAGAGWAWLAAQLAACAVVAADAVTRWARRRPRPASLVLQVRKRVSRRRRPPS